MAAKAVSPVENVEAQPCAQAPFPGLQALRQRVKLAQFRSALQAATALTHAPLPVWAAPAQVLQVLEPLLPVEPELPVVPEPDGQLSKSQ